MLVLKGHRGRVRTLAFSGDGSKLASAAGHGKAVSLWDLAKGGRRTYLSGHYDWVTSVCFAPSGNLLASLAEQVKLWDTATAGHRRDVRAPAGQRDYALLFAPDGRTLLAASSGGGAYRVRHLDVDTGTEVPGGLEHPTRPYSRTHPASNCLALAPRGGRLAVGLDSGVAEHRQVHLWDPAEGKLLHRLPLAGPLRALAWSPDGRTLAVAVQRTVTLWDAATGQPRAVLKRH